jgi:hypothetical protein
MLSRRTLPEWYREQRNHGLREPHEQFWVILTAIVTLPDKNSQFLGQMRLRWWNIPET